MDEILLELTLLEIYQSKQKDQLIKLIYQNLSELKYNRILSNLSSYQTYKLQLSQLMNNDIDQELFISNPISLREVYQDYQNVYYKNSSCIMFPNQLVFVYPKIRIYHSTKDILCHFDGSVIKKNELCLSYRPLLDNLDTNERFVLRNTIKVNPSYKDILPSNIQELEFLYEHYLNPNLPNQYDDIYFDEFRSGYTFSLVKLKKKK